MTDEELKAEGPPKELDNTMRSEWRSCPRRFYWNRRGFTWRGKPAYFAAGIAWHQFIEDYYTLLQAPQVGHIMATEAAIKGAQEVYLKELGDVEPSKNDTFENMEALMRLYASTYTSEPWKLVSGETGWLWPLDSKHLYGGSVDGYIEWPGYGTLAIENKTVGMYLNESYINQWAYSPQITGIIWGLTGFLGQEVFGCLMNMASKVMRGPKSKAQTPQFTRRLEKRSKARLDEFRLEVLRDFEDIEREYDRWVWPMTTNPIECAGGVGRKPCLYKEICLLPIPFQEIDPLEYSYIIMSEEKWQPWKREGGQS